MLEQIVIGTVGPLIAYIALRILEYFTRERKERQRQKEESEKALMLALTCVITNTEFDRQERIDAYEEYKTLGGSTWIDDYVTKHLKNAGD
jgi:hypothetical protein